MGVPETGSRRMEFFLLEPDSFDFPPWKERTLGSDIMELVREDTVRVCGITQ